MIYLRHAVIVHSAILLLFYFLHLMIYYEYQHLFLNIMLYEIRLLLNTYHDMTHECITMCTLTILECVLV